MEAILGAVILTVGLFHLMKQEEGLNTLIDTVNYSLLQQEELDQQPVEARNDLITNEEMVIVLTGYREYPINMDGTVIEVDDTDYDTYIALIKDGYYLKSYSYDTSRQINQVNYSYLGM
jgi:hypothetical protein